MTSTAFSAFRSPFAHFGTSSLQRKSERHAPIHRVVVARNVRNRARISACVDESPPAPSAAVAAGPTFRQSLTGRVPEWLLARLEELSLTTPTPVQAQSLPLSLGAAPGELGSDVVLHAETGSGKTLAYLLPVLSALDLSRSTTQAVVLVPTQELCAQVTGAARRLAAGAPRALPVLALLDGPEAGGGGGGNADAAAAARRQAQQLRAGAPRVVVGNARRVAALARAGRLRLDLVRALVVDEVDAVLGDARAVGALQTVLAARFREGARQTIFASATVPQVRHFLRQCVAQRWARPGLARVAPAAARATPAGLAHYFALCARGRKLAALRALLAPAAAADGARAERCLVFAARARDVCAIAAALADALGAEVAAIDAGVHGVARRESFARFKRGELRILVATDIAARGLDLPDVATVFHLDLPTDADAYLHRAGRSARAGKVGRSVVLLEDGEQFVVGRIANKLDIEFQRIKKGSLAA